MEGATPSVTMTLKFRRLILPAASFELYLMGVVPTGKVLPLAGPRTRTTETAPSQLSVAVGVVQVTTAVHDP